MFKKKILAALLGIGALGTAMVAAAAPASADPVTCGEYYCAYVTGINSGSYLAIRTGPHYSSSKLAGFKEHNGNKAIINCWVLGDADADGHGDTYWWNVEFPYGGNGYVNDYYLTTGSSATFKGYPFDFTHC